MFEKENNPYPSHLSLSLVSLCPGFSCKGSSEFASSNICKACCVLSGIYRQCLLISHPLGLENIFLAAVGIGLCKSL